MHVTPLIELFVDKQLEQLGMEERYDAFGTYNGKINGEYIGSNYNSSHFAYNYYTSCA